MINEKKKKKKDLTFGTSILLENGRVGMGLEISQEKKKICVVDYFTNGRKREREREGEDRNWFKDGGIYLDIGVRERISSGSKTTIVRNNFDFVDGKRDNEGPSLVTRTLSWRARRKYSTTERNTSINQPNSSAWLFNVGIFEIQSIADRVYILFKRSKTRYEP